MSRGPDRLARWLGSHAPVWPRLTAAPLIRPFPPGDALRQRLVLWSVGVVGFLTGAAIGLFWDPAAALLAMLTAALVSWFDRR